MHFYLQFLSLFLTYIFSSQVEAYPYPCTEGIAGVHNYSSQVSAAGYAFSGLGGAENNCSRCQNENRTEFSNCMRRIVTENVGGRRSIEEAYSQQLRHGPLLYLHRMRTGNWNIQESEYERLESALNESPSCRMIAWSGLRASSSGNLIPWIRNRDRCVTEHLCVDATDYAECVRRSSISFALMEGTAVEYFQTTAIAEALENGQSAPEEMDFEDDSIEGSPDSVATPEPAGESSPQPYYPSHRRIRGVSTDQFDALSAQGQAREEEAAEALRDAIATQSGCPPQGGEMVIPEGESRCIRWNLDGVEPTLVTLSSQVHEIVANFLYKDIARFAVQRVWESYSVAMLMDPNLDSISCSSRSAFVERVAQNINFDTFMEAPSGAEYGDGMARLTQCFGESGLNVGTQRISDLAETAYNFKCQNSRDVRSDAICSQTTQHSDDGTVREQQIDNFRDRIRMMHFIQERRRNLRDGTMRIQGQVVTCGTETCATFLDQAESCERSGFVGTACLAYNPQYMNEERKRAWTAWTNLRQTENRILTENPELSSEVTYVDSNNRRVTEPVWQALRDDNPVRMNTGNYFDIAVAQSRRKKLDFVLNEPCSDPEDFALKMLLNNPQLIDEYIRQHPSPDIGALVCVGMGEASHSKWVGDALKAGATLTVLALGAAAAIPSGGSSVALTLAALSTAGAVGLTAHDLASAYQRMSLERGMLHGCIGDFGRAQRAHDQLESAMLWAAIDLGVGVGVFAAMGAVERIATLRRLAGAAEALEGVEPRWLTRINSAETRLNSFERAQRGYVASEFGLESLPGMMRNGSLTTQGRETADAILRMERMGFSREAIAESIRTCRVVP